LTDSDQAAVIGAVRSAVLDLVGQPAA
jgi:hypothetical protein